MLTRSNIFSVNSSWKTVILSKIVDCIGHRRPRSSRLSRHSKDATDYVLRAYLALDGGGLVIESSTCIITRKIRRRLKRCDFEYSRTASTGISSSSLNNARLMIVRYEGNALILQTVMRHGSIINRTTNESAGREREFDRNIG